MRLRSKIGIILSIFWITALGNLFSYKKDWPDLLPKFTSGIVRLNINSGFKNQWMGYKKVQDIFKKIQSHGLNPNNIKKIYLFWIAADPKYSQLWFTVALKGNYNPSKMYKKLKKRGYKKQLYKSSAYVTKGAQAVLIIDKKWLLITPKDKHVLKYILDVYKSKEREINDNHFLKKHIQQLDQKQNRVHSLWDASNTQALKNVFATSPGGGISFKALQKIQTLELTYQDPNQTHFLKLIAHFKNATEAQDAEQAFKSFINYMRQLIQFTSHSQGASSPYTKLIQQIKYQARGETLDIRLTLTKKELESLLNLVAGINN